MTNWIGFVQGQTPLKRIKTTDSRQMFLLLMLLLLGGGGRRERKCQRIEGSTNTQIEHQTSTIEHRSIQMNSTKKKRNYKLTNHAVECIGIPEVILVNI